MPPSSSPTARSAPRKVTKPVTGQYAAAGVNPRRHLAELRLDDESAAAEYEVGQELTAEIFADGSVRRRHRHQQGQGFAGTMKRHGFRARAPATAPRPSTAAPAPSVAAPPRPCLQGHPDVGPDG